MGSYNRLIVVGNLGRDAELKYTPGGAAVCKFSVACNETWTGKDGQKNERTEWFSVDLWGKQAESLTEFLRKGKQVLVEGRMSTEEWTDKDGQKRKTVKVRADRIVLLGSAGSGRPQTSESDDSQAAPPQLDGPPAAIPEDDIPF
jgi:single-strand DNA-binding protein